jgi:acetylglutamate kinase
MTSPQVRQRTTAKARTLLEALPFMQEHRGKILVVKVGGAAMDRAPLSRAFAEDVSLLQHVGVLPVLVHGGGPQVTGVAERLGLQSTFVDGVRVTDRETLDVATMVLAGKVNTEIVAMLGASGVRAVGLSGVDGGLALAAKRAEPDLGFVGDVVRVDPSVVATLLAVGLGAAKLVYVSDVPGVIDASGELLSELGVQDALDLLAGHDVVTGGMIPKLESAVHALKSGVDRVHLLDGRVEHALVLELFTPEGIGTMVAGERPGGSS